MRPVLLSREPDDRELCTQVIIFWKTYIVHLSILNVCFELGNDLFKLVSRKEIDIRLRYKDL